MLDIQEEIDAIVKKYPKARAFLRPSGTEDVLRLYVEAEDSFEATKIADYITKIILEDKEIN